ncbi:putative damage-inducible protein DinB [Dyadobacter jejuensis]|uniref:Putative damage-inducible protein DinB n=2 Tax=Dyadobacter jejuensis TaxID=1082580 RepID=A0A316AMZ2_9BACT|nr:putative damage-inducible protein DinB [Dyadobacter jejuensis]
MYQFLALFFLVAFPALAQQPPSDPFIKDELLRWENARNYTLAVVEALPESEFGFKPVAEEMDFSAQIVHLSDNILWLTSKFIAQKPASFSAKDYNGKGKKELIQLVNQTFDYAQASFASFPADKLSEEVDFAGQKMTRRRIFFLINDHLTHHRAQMIVYLRLQGIAPPKYVGW